MANTVYDNFYLSNEIEDQYKSHLDLQTFCTVDNALEGTAGMLRKINVYKATDGTEKLAMGAGNSKSIEVGFTPREYRIQLAQNRFKYYDEQAMTDPQLVPVGTKHMGTDMFNTVNADIYGEFAKATQVVVVTKLNFDAFADAQSVLALEDLEGVTIFAFVSPADHKLGKSHCRNLRAPLLCSQAGKRRCCSQRARQSRRDLLERLQHLLAYSAGRVPLRPAYSC